MSASLERGVYWWKHCRKIWKCTCSVPLFWHSMEPKTASTRPRMPPVAVALLPNASTQGALDLAQCGQFGHQRTPKRCRRASCTTAQKPLCARQRVPGQHGPPLLVAWQRLGKYFRVQLHEIHVQVWLVSGLEVPVIVVRHGGVILPSPCQAKHDGGVPL